MTSMREIGGEILVLGGGIGVVICAYHDGQKPWVCFLLSVVTWWMDEVLIRLRKSQEGRKA